MQYIANRISLDEELCNGKPTIRGKRISVQTVLGYLGAGESKEEILRQYPSLEVEDIYACIQFAADLLKNNFQLKQQIINLKNEPGNKKPGAKSALE